ncbi:MAG: hypothetical protein H7318_05150 [Oligoflexus sp.]|nr:hypothetical protein [Oligoflexus sp.]
MKISYSFLIVFQLSLISACQKNSDETIANPADTIELAKIAAATATANSNSLCASIQPFYWEIGSGTGALGKASVGGVTPDANTVLQIASATKMIFASYVLEKRNGVLSAAEIKGLNFTSGYSTFTSCVGQSTVSLCYANATAYNELNDNKFYYGGGHMQKIAAVDLGIGETNSTKLAAEISNFIGNDLGVVFNIPQPAGGVQLSANGYAIFLRNILNKNLRMTNFLGSDSICTNPITCPSMAVYTPIPSSESWNYSLGHWVESDPVNGDGSFSSPGLYGFYPWISSDKTRYGIVARYDTGSTAYWDSVLCGRMIRKAYLSGVAQ